MLDVDASELGRAKAYTLNLEVFAGIFLQDDLSAVNC